MGLRKTDVEAAYVRGLHEGAASARADWRKATEADAQARKLDAVLRLVNAVGQTLQAQAGLVQGLAASLDELKRP